MSVSDPIFIGKESMEMLRESLPYLFVCHLTPKHLVLMFAKKHVRALEATRRSRRLFVLDLLDFLRHIVAHGMDAPTK